MCLVSLLKEEMLYIFWQLFLQNVANKTFADIGSTPFIAKDIAKSWIAKVKTVPIIIAGITASAEDADDAWLL